MLKVEVNKGMNNLVIVGTIDELLADVMTALHTIYEKLTEADADGACTFKEYMTGAIELAFVPADKMKEAAAELLEKKLDVES